MRRDKFISVLNKAFNNRAKLYTVKLLNDIKLFNSLLENKEFVDSHWNSILSNHSKVNFGKLIYENMNNDQHLKIKKFKYIES